MRTRKVLFEIAEPFLKEVADTAYGGGIADCIKQSTYPLAMVDAIDFGMDLPMFYGL